jgi:glycosyltransferase involved in cell wall biosynthesis
MGGISDIVVDGETGFLFPPGDGRALASALESIVNDPRRRTAFGKAGRRRAVERFDARVNAGRLVRLLQDIAAKPPRANQR